MHRGAFEVLRKREQEDEEEESESEEIKEGLISTGLKFIDDNYSGSYSKQE